jgi:hypothetical protein
MASSLSETGEALAPCVKVGPEPSARFEPEREPYCQDIKVLVFILLLTGSHKLCTGM